MIRWGANRVVVLTRRYAIKLPRLRCFRYGRLNNLNEWRWQHEDRHYCPVLWCAPFGLLSIMPRVQPIHPLYECYLPRVLGVERKT